MKALISPTQQNFVVQVIDDNLIFDVSEPLYWVDCPDTITAYSYTYSNSQFIAYVPPAPAYVASPEPTKAELLAQLQELTAKIQALGE